MEVAFNPEIQDDNKVRKWQVVIHKEDGKGTAYEAVYMVYSETGVLTALGCRAFTSVIPAKRWLSSVIGHDVKYTASADRKKLMGMTETKEA
jgi:hypothetical protein